MTDPVIRSSCYNNQKCLHVSLPMYKKLIWFSNNQFWFSSARESGNSQWEGGKGKSCEREARVRLSGLWSASESTKT